MRQCELYAINTPTYSTHVGAMFDSEMKMKVQVQRVCSSAWYPLYNISKIRQDITTDQTKIVIHAYVTSKLDFNNALFFTVFQNTSETSSS